MKINICNKNGGFTLIELLIVVALFAGAIAGGTGMFLSLVKNNRKTEKLLEVKRAGDGIIFDFEREVKWAKDVADPASCPAPGTDTAINEVEILNVDDESVSYNCEVNTGDDEDYIWKQVGSGDIYPLLNSNLGYQISSCDFYCYTNNGRHSVKFVFELESPSSLNETVKQEFSANVVLRNSQP